MEEKPRKPNESFFAHGGAFRTALFGALIGLATVFIFWYGYHSRGFSPFDSNIPEEVLEYARTLAFMTLILAQMFFAVSIQSEKHSIFSPRMWKNKMLIASIVLAVGLQFLLIYNPFLHDIFHLTYLEFSDWDIVVLTSLIPVAVNEIRKFLQK